MGTCIDSHHHIWTLERGDYDWLTPDHGVLYRDYGLEEYCKLLDGHQIDQSILVQAAPTLEETQFLLSEAEANARISGVVGWLNLQSTDFFRDVDRLAERPKCVGIRPMLQDMDEIGWLLRPDLRPAIERLIFHGLCFDTLIRPGQLPTITAFAQLYPSLSIVLNHAGKPNISAHRYAWWQRDLQALSACPNVTCKLSGLVTEAGPDWRPEHLKTVFDTLMAAFGPKRLLWGSDWPMVNLAGGLYAWWRASRVLCAPLSLEDTTAIFGGNAMRVYGRGIY